MSFPVPMSARRRLRRRLRTRCVPRSWLSGVCIPEIRLPDFCALFLGLLALAGSAHAAETAALDVTARLGWDGHVRLGRWNTASVQVSSVDTAGLTLECRAADSEGHAAIFQDSAADHSAAADQASARLTTVFSVPFQVGRIDTPIQLRLLRDKEVVWSRIYRATGEAGWTPLVLSDRLIVTVGQPRGFDQLDDSSVGRPGQSGNRVVNLASAAELPEDFASWRSVDWLVLAGKDAPSTAALKVIEEWVRQGGRVFVSLPSQPAVLADSPLKSWLPFKFATAPALVRELGSLEAFAGRNLRIPYTGRLEMPRIEPGDGIVLAASREDAVLVSRSWGLGEVLLLSLDLTTSPLSNWGGLPDLISKCIAVDRRTTINPTEQGQNSVGQLTSSGISDLASQLQATQDTFGDITRPAPWWSMVWLLVLLVVIGPVDYFLVHHLLKWPRLTWLTLPVWIGGLCLYATTTGPAWNRQSLVVNQTDVIDVDAATNVIRGKSWATLYSPDTARYDVTMQPATGAWESIWSGLSDSSRLTGWFYVPEATTGGLYRTVGGEWGRTDYLVQPRLGQIERLPLLQWSSRTLASEWSGTAAQLVDSNFRNTGLGRLTGDFTHHLPGRLTDWMLAYGSRVYRLQPSRDDDSSVPLEAGQRVSTDNPLMLQADLRSLLTRIVITEEQESSRISERRLNREQGRYDVYDRDATRLWQIVSFHREAGGGGYTGLTNHWLHDDDLSRQLELGHAVLFGRLESPAAASLTVNGQPLAAGRSTVVVRLVLPVRKSGEILRTLPKFDEKDK